MHLHRLLTAGALLCVLSASAQKGYEINIQLEHFKESSIVVAYYFGEKQYVKDTIRQNRDGQFIYSADTLLPSGVYLLVLPPDNRFVQFILPEKDQRFTLSADADDVEKTTRFKGSEDNETFHAYLAYLSGMRVRSDTLRAQLSRLKKPDPDSARIARDLNDLDAAVKKYQKDLIARHAGSAVAKIVQSTLEPEIPAFEGAPEAVELQRYTWYRAHYFDNMDPGDPFFLHSPMLHNRVNGFITNYLPKHPDTINSGLDQLLALTKRNPLAHRYYLAHFLNYFAKPTYVGMDACYVHLALRYICPEAPAWLKPKDLESICDDARRIAPLLIGKTAPDVTLKDRDNQPVRLYDVDADYTVLFFWKTGCGYCKEAAPHIVAFANKYKDKGVKVFAVCTDVGEKAGACWDDVKEKQFNDQIMINAWDPTRRSRYDALFDTRLIPSVYILDRAHVIRMKGIKADQLDSVMENLLLQRK